MTLLGWSEFELKSLATWGFGFHMFSAVSKSLGFSEESQFSSHPCRYPDVQIVVQSRELTCRRYFIQCQAKTMFRMREFFNQASFWYVRKSGWLVIQPCVRCIDFLKIILIPQVYHGTWTWSFEKEDSLLEIIIFRFPSLNVWSWDLKHDRSKSNGHVSCHEN